MTKIKRHNKITNLKIRPIRLLNSIETLKINKNIDLRKQTKIFYFIDYGFRGTEVRRCRDPWLSAGLVPYRKRS